MWYTANVWFFYENKPTLSQTVCKSKEEIGILYILYRSFQCLSLSIGRHLWSGYWKKLNKIFFKQHFGFAGVFFIVFSQQLLNQICLKMLLELWTYMQLKCIIYLRLLLEFYKNLCKIKKHFTTTIHTKSPNSNENWLNLHFIKNDMKYRSSSTTRNINRKIFAYGKPSHFGDKSSEFYWLSALFVA